MSGGNRCDEGDDLVFAFRFNFSFSRFPRRGTSFLARDNPIRPDYTESSTIFIVTDNINDLPLAARPLGHLFHEDGPENIGLLKTLTAVDHQFTP